MTVARSVVLSLVLAVGLGGCASIPTSGPVHAGSPPDRVEEPDYHVEPLGPATGMEPVPLVRGFLLAGVGAEDDFAAARGFLSGARRSTWRPTGRTVVYPVGALAVSDPVPQADGTVVVTATAPVEAEVDEDGRYAASGPGATTTLALQLAQERGQWRITNAPDLLLLDDTDFTSTFNPQPIYFTDRSSGRPVPELRWLLDRASTATTIVNQVLAGPSPWLAPTASSGAPAASSLGRGGSVPVTDHEAHVDLPPSALRLAPAALTQVQREVELSLLALPDVYAVQVAVAGGDLPAIDPAPSSPGVDSSPVVLSAGVLARLSTGRVTPVPGLPPLAGAGLSAPAVDGSRYAVLAAGRTQLLLLAQGRTTPPAVALTGVDLTAPSIDADGWTWSTSADSVGTVTAVSGQGQVVAVKAPWLAGRRLASLRISRDGSRAVIASTGPGGDAPVRVDVAAVLRDGDGVPAQLTAPDDGPTPWLASVRAAVWVDPTTVAVIGAAAPGTAQAATGGTGTTVWQVQGGRVTWLGTPASAAEPATLACSEPTPSLLLNTADAVRTLLVGTADGVLWQRSGVQWAPVQAGGTDPSYEG